MELKEITPQDWELYKNFRLEALQSPDARAFGGTYKKESLWTEEEWRSLFDRSKPRFFYGYFNEHKILSVAGVYLNQENNEFHNEWIFVGIYTDPEFRGQGFSFKAISAVLDALRSKGVRKAVLMVDTRQTAAICLYEKLGFKTIKLNKDQKSEYDIYDELVMEKAL